MGSSSYYLQANQPEALLYLPTSSKTNNSKYFSGSLIYFGGSLIYFGRSLIYFGGDLIYFGGGLIYFQEDCLAGKENSGKAFLCYFLGRKNLFTKQRLLQRAPAFRACFCYPFLNLIFEIALYSALSTSKMANR